MELFHKQLLQCCYNGLRNLQQNLSRQLQKTPDSHYNLTNKKNTPHPIQ